MNAVYTAFKNNLVAANLSEKILKHIYETVIDSTQYKRTNLTCEFSMKLNMVLKVFSQGMRFTGKKLNYVGLMS